MARVRYDYSIAKVQLRRGKTPISLFLMSATIARSHIGSPRMRNDSRLTNMRSRDSHGHQKQIDRPLSPPQPVLRHRCTARILSVSCEVAISPFFLSPLLT